MIQNATLFISRIDNETRLNITFPNETYYSDSALEQIYFNVSVDALILQNSTLVASFNLSSDVSNITSTYSIIAYVTYDNELVTFKSEDFLTLQDADYYQNFTTDMLPLQRTYEFKIAGPSEQLLNVSCSEAWMECPNNATFGSNNQTTINVKIELASSFAIGNYTGNINFTIGNLTRIAKIIIRIKRPDYSFEEYMFTDKCFEKSLTGKILVTYDCMEEKAEFEHQQQLELIERLKADYQECNFTCEEPETEYVVSGSLEDALAQPYNSCKEDLSETRSQLTKCRENDDACVSDRKACMRDISKERELNDNYTKGMMENETICLANTFSQAVQREDIARQVRKSTIWSVIRIIAGFVFFSVLAGYFIYLYLHRKNEVTLQ